MRAIVCFYMREKLFLMMGLLIVTLFTSGCATTESSTKQARLSETREEWNNPPGALTELRTQEVVAELSHP
jgi:hypothetical protein